MRRRRHTATTSDSGPPARLLVFDPLDWPGDTAHAARAAWLDARDAWRIASGVPELPTDPDQYRLDRDESRRHDPEAVLVASRRRLARWTSEGFPTAGDFGTRELCPDRCGAAAWREAP